MEASTFKEVSKRGIKGWVREELIDLLPPAFFEDPIFFIREMGGKVIRESRLRWAAILTLPDGRRIFFKRDRTKGWLESLKFLLLPSKAKKEWFIVCRSQKRDIPIPKPLGWMERLRWGLVVESYYLSEAIGSGASLIEDFNQLRDGSIAAGLAKTLKGVHDRGLFHKDLHAGNFLWDGESFFLSDLHRAEVKRSLSLNERLWNLSQLFHSLRSKWGEGEEIKFIEKYFDGEPVYLQKRDEILQKVHFMMERLQKRQWQSRSKRCLKESTEFSIKKEKGVHYYHRRDFLLNRALRVIDEHLQFIKEKPSALTKQNTEVIVSLLNNGESKVCVKQYRYPNFSGRIKELFRHSKGLKAWIAGNGLITRGIPSLKPFALVEKRDWLGLKESFFLMEASETGQELDRYLFKGFKDLKEKRLFIKSFAQWLSHFHKMGLYHQDMKTCNILISKNGEIWNFRLLDLEDVELDERVDERKLLKNFLQLNTSTPRIMTRTDRLRFFREYIRLNPMIKNQKGFLCQLIEESRRRGLVYVSPQGVIEERW